MARQALEPSLKDLPSTRLELATQRAEGELATTVLIPPPLERDVIRTNGRTFVKRPLEGRCDVGVKRPLEGRLGRLTVSRPLESRT